MTVQIFDFQRISNTRPAEVSRLADPGARVEIEARSARADYEASLRHEPRVGMRVDERCRGLGTPSSK